MTYDMSVHVFNNPDDFVYKGYGMNLKYVLEMVELSLREYGDEMEIVIKPA